MLAYSAYCEAPYLKNWNCYWCNSTNVKVNHVFHNEKTNIYGFIGIFENKSNKKNSKKKKNFLNLFFFFKKFCCLSEEHKFQV